MKERNRENRARQRDNYPVASFSAVNICTRWKCLFMNRRTSSSCPKSYRKPALRSSRSRKQQEGDCTDGLTVTVVVAARPAWLFWKITMGAITRLLDVAGHRCLFPGGQRKTVLVSPFSFDARPRRRHGHRVLVMAAPYRHLCCCGSNCCCYVVVGKARRCLIPVSVCAPRRTGVRSPGVVRRSH